MAPPSCIALPGWGAHGASGIKRLVAVAPWTRHFCWEFLLGHPISCLSQVSKVGTAIMTPLYSR